MSGRRTTPYTARNIKLPTDLTPEEFEDAAGKAFFPQPLTPPDPHLYESRQPVNDERPEAAFNIQELTLALDADNVRRDPGKDSIPWQMLHNLDEPEKHELLEELNKI